MKNHQPQSPEHDVIILGSGLGGLTAAALLSRKGVSVLLLREKSSESSFVRDGYHFVPFSNFSERIVRPEILKWLSQALPLSPSSSASGGTGQPRRKSSSSKDRVAFQAILPNSRIDLFEDRRKLLKEWEREFPKEVTQLDEFHHRMDLLVQKLKEGKPELNVWPFCVSESRGFFTRWLSSDPPLDLSSFSREFRQFIRLQLISWGNFMTDEFPDPLAASLLSGIRSSLPFPASASEDLKRRILAALIDRGGSVEEIDGIKEATIHWRAGVTIISGEDQKEFRSRLVIMNAPLHRMAEVPGTLSKKLSRYGRRIKPGYVSIPLFLGLQEKVIPVGMRDLLVSIADLEKPYEGGNILFISLSPAGEEREAPEGKRAVTVQSLVPMEKLDRTSLMDHQRMVMEHLSRLIPYLDRYTDFVEFDWTLDQVSRWSNWGYPHFFYEISSDFRWEEGILPVRLSRGVYLSGKEGFPYLGLEGEMMSGWKVASALIKKFGKS
jgi:phytoene dehydrogenase-like protein